MFGILGAISVISILVGIFAHDTLGADLSGILVIGGAILGSVNVLIEVASLYKK